VVLKRLPRETVVHRLSVVTKLVTLAILTVATLVNPHWDQIAATAGVVTLAVVAARVPRNAMPRLPAWFWITMLAGLGLSALGHGAGRYLQLVAISTLFMTLSAIVAWTTAMDEVAPAVATLGAPFRRIGLPVDEWAFTTALCVRSLPLLVDEYRILVAARRLRPRERLYRPRVLVATIIDLLTATMVATIRRATDMGEAVTARGGGTRITARPGRFSWRDALVLAVVAGSCAAPAILSG
jgi:energy-coupling factor transport system permease protein